MYKLYNRDSLEVMKGMEGNTINLILTDPPYNLGNFMKNRQTNLGKMRENFFGNKGWDELSFDEWYDNMDHFFSEADRVIKKGGAIVVFMAVIKVESLVELAQKHGFYYKTTGVWHKTNPMPRNMNLHFVNSNESWVYFVKGARTGTFNNHGKLILDYIETSVTPKSETLFGRHPTQKPVQLMAHFINLLSNEGDMIFDPFMGSGTTGVAAVCANRNFIGVDLSSEYTKIATNRITEVLTQPQQETLELDE
ncbi:DNA-methyltransferase [Loigolactobacillus coryniformis]|nr:site-specific DNA-methyltransferase [Loigolactobacillus coryniformis]KRK74443.1 DNA (cytosine-5-)-methyltransferase [Loigolactobacillus coryniformis subsp. torquens DSM 20004 = KCTC 3535]